MKRLHGTLLFALTLVIGAVAPAGASAMSSYYSSSCASCHGASPTTCNGCHRHRGTPSGSIGKTTFAPGEAIPVTVNAGQRSGWWRGAVLDETDRIVGTVSATASGPATVTVRAPSAAGTYTWKVAWYGNAYTETPAAESWVPDAGNDGHGYLTAPLAAFTVAIAPAPEPVAALAPAALDMGTVTTGQASTRSATVSNTGTADLVVAAPAPCSGSNPASLTISPAAGFTVASGGSATVTVSFAPTAAGAAVGCWTLATNDPAHPALRLDATGTGASQPPPPSQSCTTCHAIPPATGKHSAHAAEGCGACHGAGYSDTTVVDATHRNSRVDLAASAGWTASSASCANACHTARSWGSAPPPPPPPSCTTCHALPPATGKHTAHASRGCGDCHGAGYSSTTVVAATHQDGKATLGAGAGWNATAKSCANACHGNESWGGTTPPPGQKCSSCHAMPPTSGKHAKHRSEHVSCAACHGSGYSTTTVNATTHNNGAVNLTSSVRWNASQRSCANSCHGTERWGGTGPSPTACTTCHGIPPSSGEHAKHQSKRVGCGTCHGTGYTSSTVVASTHRNGKVNISSRIGWKSSRRTCSNSCHHTESWVRSRGGGDDHEEDDFVIAGDAPTGEDLTGGGCSSAGGSLSLLGLVGLGLASVRRRRRG